MLVTDESGSMSADRRRPVAARRRALGRPELPRPRAGQAAGRLRRLLHADQRGRRADARPHAGSSARSTPCSADGGTATGDALDAALDRLAARRGKDGKRAPAAIVLLSDGKRTEGSDPLAAAAARQAARHPGLHRRARHRRRHRLRAAAASRSPSRPIPTRCGRSARITGGTFTETADAGELDDVYKRLGSQIGTQAREAGGQLRLRRRRPAPAARRARHRPAPPRPAALILI